MSLASSIRTIAVWEMNRSMTTMGEASSRLRRGLLVLLVLVTAFAAQSGVHMQDGMYRIGIDDPEIARIVAPDSRFTPPTSTAGGRPSGRTGSRTTSSSCRARSTPPIRTKGGRP